MNRRGFLRGILAAGVAPYVCTAAGVLMPVRPLARPAALGEGLVRISTRLLKDSSCWELIVRDAAQAVALSVDYAILEEHFSALAVEVGREGQAVFINERRCYGGRAQEA